MQWICANDNEKQAQTKQDSNKQTITQTAARLIAEKINTKANIAVNADLLQPNPPVYN